MASGRPFAPPDKRAKNFIKKYSKERFIQLLDMLKRRVSGDVIAEEFGVTRQQIYYWRDAFGDEHYVYYLKPEIQKLLKIEETPLPKTRITV